MIAIPLLVLRGCQEQHGTLSLFHSECFQIPGGRLHKFLQRPLRLLLINIAGVSSLRGVVGERNREGSKTKFAPEQKRLDPEASSRGWRCKHESTQIVHTATKKWAWLTGILHPQNLFL